MTPPATESESVETQLAVINTKLDILIQQRSDHELRLRTLEDNTLHQGEERMRSLEQFKWALLGACIAGGGGAGALASKLLA